MSLKELPDFYVLGFQRCATSSLNDLFVKSNVISTPTVKETHFFSNDALYKKDINWYKKQFIYKKNHNLIGEVDPSYIVEDNSLLRLKKNNPKCRKFIFILRKPLERSYSHYLLSKYRGYENNTFLNAITIEEKRLKNEKKSIYKYGYIKRSNYFEQIKRFENIFSNVEVLYIDFNRLVNIKTVELECCKIWNFLKIDSNVCIDTSKKNNHNVIYKNKIFRNILYKESVVKNFVKTFLPYSTVFVLKEYFSSLNEKNNINYEKQKILDLNLPDNFLQWNNNETKKIESLTGMDLKEWYCK